MFAPPTQGDSGDATDDEMVSRKTRSCKEGLYRNGPESDSIDQEDPGDIYRTVQIIVSHTVWFLFTLRSLYLHRRRLSGTILSLIH